MFSFRGFHPIPPLRVGFRPLTLHQGLYPWNRSRLAPRHVLGILDHGSVMDGRLMLLTQRRLARNMKLICWQAGASEKGCEQDVVIGQPASEPRRRPAS